MIDFCRNCGIIAEIEVISGGNRFHSKACEEQYAAFLASLDGVITV